MTRQSPRNRLTLYRRHSRSCPEGKKPRRKQNLYVCDCQFWVQGRLNGDAVRQPLNTRQAPAAQLICDQMLHGIVPPPPPPPPSGGLCLVGSVADEPAPETVTLDFAQKQFFEHKKDSIATGTMIRYRGSVLHFCRWAESQGVDLVSKIRTPLVQSYFSAQTWNSLRSKIQRRKELRVFFLYCVERGWTPANPTTSKTMLKFEQPKDYARKPFSREEVGRIRDAIFELPPEEQPRARALILLMLYSGMRISDVTFCERASVTGRSGGRAGHVISYQSIKDRDRIPPIKLHPEAVAALNALPPSRVYFFQPDQPGDYRAARRALREGRKANGFADVFGRTAYQRALHRVRAVFDRVLELARVEGSCHCFRDTFAVNLLVAGVSIEYVAEALGHHSTDITRDHYLNLVDEYRERMSEMTDVLDFGSFSEPSASSKSRHSLSLVG